MMTKKRGQGKIQNRESRLGTPIPGDSEMMKVGDNGFFAVCLGVAPSI